MHVCILHQAVAADAAPDEQDVLCQVDAVRQALVRLGHRTETVACTLDLASLDAALAASRPDLVFNLVESVNGYGRLIHLAPSLLDARQTPYTGCSADSLFLTSHKLLAKSRLREARLPTPPWISAGDAPQTQDPADVHTWLVKSVWEHASQGMDDSCLMRNATPAAVAALLPGFAARMGGDCFAEAYIDGREFNLGLLAGPHGPEALPAAELVFRDYPAGKPKIVGYQAKWDAGSFEYLNTIRRFADDPADAPLLEEMRRLARQCWSVFGLAGIARVDFRVDEQNRPWILEINANPCISPDSGFAAMLKQAGIPYDQAVARLIEDAQARAARKGRLLPDAGAGRDPTSSSTLSSTSTTQLTTKAHQTKSPVTFRYEVVPVDRAHIRDLVHSTGFFHAEEVDIAVELVDEWLAKGASSGYEFVIAEQDGRIVGYTCFGLIPCTQSSYDLYWIAVHPKTQGQGLGRLLNAETERRIREKGGTRIYAETSSRPQYQSTRAFYERTGYRLAEMLADFYAPGDGRATYLKIL